MKTYPYTFLFLDRLWCFTFVMLESVPVWLGATNGCWLTDGWSGLQFVLDVVPGWWLCFDVVLVCAFLCSGWIAGWEIIMFLCVSGYFAGLCCAIFGPPLCVCRFFIYSARLGFQGLLNLDDLCLESWLQTWTGSCWGSGRGFVHGNRFPVELGLDMDAWQNLGLGLKISALDLIGYGQNKDWFKKGWRLNKK